jgi:hypothetical protein
MDESNQDELLAQFPDLEEFEGQPSQLVSDEPKIEGMELHPEQDGQRVVVGVTVTPSHEHPNLEIVILAPDGTVAAEALIVESRSARQVMTLHLRPFDPALTYTVKAGLFRDKELIDTYEMELTWPQ